MGRGACPCAGAGAGDEREGRLSAVRTKGGGVLVRSALMNEAVAGSPARTSLRCLYAGAGTGVPLWLPAGGESCTRMFSLASAHRSRTILGLRHHAASALLPQPPPACPPARRRDSEGRTCLHYAAGYGHEECVDVLLEHSADPRARDSNGDVPLHFAAIHGHPMCAYNIAKVSGGQARRLILCAGCTHTRNRGMQCCNNIEAWTGLCE